MYSAASECPGNATPPSFHSRGQLPGSIQPCGEMTPEYFRDSSSVSVASTPAWLMWSGLTIWCLSIIRRTTWRPSSVSPRVLQWGAGGYAGALPPWSPTCPSSPLSAVLSCGLGVKIVLSVNGVVQVRALQYEPALSLLPALISTPDGPLSNLTPDSGLSNLLSRSIDRTPIPHISSSWRSTWAWSQLGWSQPRQSNGSDISISSTTAMRPWLITLRASYGSVTIWKKPLPGPPACAST